MPVGLALVAFSVFAGMVLFNTGQIASEKMRVTNAADAATYSGLAWQSRVLNFQSYTNRAMVANQVSIAQAVSLRSWAQYGVIASGNANRVLGGLPFVGAVTAAMEQGMKSTAPLLSAVANGLLAAADSINGALSEAQEAMFVTGFIATPEIVRKVALQNDENYHVESSYALAGSGQNLHEWDAFTERYFQDNEQAMEVRADVVTRSLDEFSRGRNWEYFGFWFYTSPFTKHRIYRRGETRLIKANSEDTGTSQWEWKAKDTVSLHNRIRRPGRSTKRIELPIGWGQAYANGETSGLSIEKCDHTDANWNPASDNGCPRWLGSNKAAELMSDENITFDGTPSRIHMATLYNGIRAFRDLADLPAQGKDPRLKLTVEVSIPGESTVTSEQLTMQDPFKVDLPKGKGEIAAISSGEIYFQRPELNSAAVVGEFANGYNPFWDVRLIPVSREEHLAAMLSRAPNLFGGSADPQTGSVPGVSSQSDLQQVSLNELPSYEELSNVDAQANADNSGADNTGTGISGHAQGNPVLQILVPSDLPSISNGNHVASVQPESIADNENLAATLLQDPAVLDTAVNLLTVDFDTAIGYINDYAEENLSLALDSVTDILQEQLQQQMEAALAAALQGALAGAGTFGGGVQTVVQDFQQLHHQLDSGLQELDSAHQQFTDALDQAFLDASVASDVIAAEIDSIQDTVAIQFEAGSAEILAAIQDDLDAIQQDIDQLTNQLSLAESPEAAALIQQELDDLVAEQMDLAASSLEKRAQLLVDITNAETDLFQIDLETAIQIVLLSDQSENPDDPFAQITDEPDEG